MANEPSLPKIELELCEQDWPLCPDPVAELVEATAGCSVVVAYAMGGNLEATIPLDQPRLRDAFRRLHNRLLEVELRLLQLETTKRHSPGKQMLIADRINRALLRLGHGED